MFTVMCLINCACFFPFAPLPMCPFFLFSISRILLGFLKPIAVFDLHCYMYIHIDSNVCNRTSIVFANDVDGFIYVRMGLMETSVAVRLQGRMSYFQIICRRRVTELHVSHFLLIKWLPSTILDSALSVMVHLVRSGEH